jgi:hypothetical protein
MRMFGLLAWHGREYTRIAPCFLWIEGWPRQPGGLQPTTGIRRDLQAFSWLRVYTALKPSLVPPTCG